MSDSKNPVTVQTADSIDRVSSSSSQPKDASVAVVNSAAGEETPVVLADKVDEEKKGFLAYFQTKEFYITLALG
jgi:solute carrier family 35 protein F1/2